MSDDEYTLEPRNTRRKLDLGRKLRLGRSPAHASSSQVQSPTLIDTASSSAITIAAGPVWQTGWSVLKRILETVRDAADLCPPLKATLVGVVELMSLVDVSLILSRHCIADLLPLSSG